MIVYVKTKHQGSVNFVEVREIEEFEDSYTLTFTADAAFEGRVKIWKDEIQEIHCEM